MLPLADLFVEVFVLIDDAIRSRGPDPTPARAHPACSDAEVLPIVLGRPLLGRPSEAGFLAEVARDRAHLFPHLPAPKRAQPQGPLAVQPQGPLAVGRLRAAAPAPGRRLPADP